MASALLVLTVSTVMLFGGRRLMHNQPGSRLEGMLSCAIGLGLTSSWYAAYPNDFAQLGDFVAHLSRTTISSDNFFAGIALAAVFPASLAFVLLLVVRGVDRGNSPMVRNIFGPLGRIRRPKILR